MIGCKENIMTSDVRGSGLELRSQSTPLLCTVDPLLLLSLLLLWWKRRIG
jgi:hypothetical protein